MHFLVKVMLFSAENTIFLYSPGRHALFRGQRHGLSRSASFHEVVRIVPEHGHRETTYEQRGQLGGLPPAFRPVKDLRPFAEFLPIPR